MVLAEAVVVRTGIGILAEGGADEHEGIVAGREMPVGGLKGVVDAQKIELAHVFQTGFVGIETGVARHLAFEDGEEELFDMVEEIVADDKVFIGLELDVVEGLVVETDVLGAAKELDEQGETDAGGSVGDLKDLGLKVLEGSTSDGDGGAFLDAPHMRAEGEAFAPLYAGLNELPHQDIGDDGIHAVDVPVMTQADPSLVPVFLKHRVEFGLGSLNEDIPTQGAADLIVELFVLRHGTGLSADEVAVEIRVFLFRFGQPVEEQVGDEVAKG